MITRIKPRVSLPQYIITTRLYPAQQGKTWWQQG